MSDSEQAEHVYRITVRGRLTRRLGSAFDDMEMQSSNGSTSFTGTVRDQTQLFGLLDRLRDFGLEVIGLEEVE